MKSSWPRIRSARRVGIAAALLCLAVAAPAPADDCAGNLALACDPAFILCFSACFNSPGAGSGTVFVAPLVPGCTWTPVPSVPWIHIDSIDTFSSPQSFTYSFDANPGASPRTGFIAVSGKSWQVRQGGTTTLSSGRVTTSGGAGVGGVLIDFSLSSIPDVTTDSLGFWQQSGFPVCNFTIATPKKTGFTFSPTKRSVSAGQFDRNFTAIPNP